MRQLRALGENEFVLPNAILSKMNERNMFGELLLGKIQAFFGFSPK